MLLLGLLDSISSVQTKPTRLLRPFVVVIPFHWHTNLEDKEGIHHDMVKERALLKQSDSEL